MIILSDNEDTPLLMGGRASIPKRCIGFPPAPLSANSPTPPAFSTLRRFLELSWVLPCAFDQSAAPLNHFYIIIVVT